MINLNSSLCCDKLNNGSIVCLSNDPSINCCIKDCSSFCPDGVCGRTVDGKCNHATVS